MVGAIQLGKIGLFLYGFIFPLSCKYYKCAAKLFIYGL